MPQLLSAAFRAFLFVLSVTLASLLSGPDAHAQNAPPKREMRGVWIASVENIDWPSRRSLTPEQQRREYIQMLDIQQKNGINAVFVQIRPAADAFYRSELEPWSKWLTGQQGKAPNPAYDPLPFLIDEAHARGMEFHAWFNPYRASLDSVTSKLAPNHPYRQHPEWFLRYSGKLLFNPGLPEVRGYINKVILDVVRRYDIDGVHFDDYFYPYPEAGQVIHDEIAYQQFNPNQLKLADWRRENVNTLVRDLHTNIQSTKRWVKFGISPFGVWMNQTSNPEGSGTAAFEGYSGLYADARLWLQQGWVDYILPQLYWSTTFKVAAYPVLLEWWARNRFDRHLYIGHGAYRIFETSKRDPSWRDPTELPRQIRLNRSYPTQVGGSVFFSSKSLVGNPLHVADSLRQDLFRYPALVPTMPWLDAVPPRPAQNLVLTRTGAAVTLFWQPGPAAPDGDEARYFVVYRFGPGETPAPDDPRRIVALVPRPANNHPALVDTTARPGVEYAYYVTAVDRLHNESAPIRASTIAGAPVLVAQAPVAPSSAAIPTVPPGAAPPPARPAPSAPARTTPAATPRPTISRPPTNTASKTKVKMKKRKRGGFFKQVFGRR